METDEEVALRPNDHRNSQSDVASELASSLRRELG